MSKDSLLRISAGDNAEYTDPKARNVENDKGEIQVHKQEEPFKQLLESYLQVHHDLYHNSLDRLPDLAELMRQASMKMDNPEKAEAIRSAVTEMAVAIDLDAARVAFGRLGIELNKLLEENGQPASLTAIIEGRKCGMYTKAPDGGVWIQVKGEAQNPFFGADSPMASCAPGQWDFSSRK